MIESSPSFLLLHRQVGSGWLEERELDWGLGIFGRRFERQYVVFSNPTDRIVPSSFLKQAINLVDKGNALSICVFLG